MNQELFAELVRVARRWSDDPGATPVVLGDHGGGVQGGGVPDGGVSDGGVSDGGMVVRVADVVVKAHPVDADPDALRRRVALAASGVLTGVLMPPLSRDGEPVTRLAGRLVTVWPAGEPSDPQDPDAAPWEAAGRVLARLHTTVLSAATASGAGPLEHLPDHGAPARLARAIQRLERYGVTVDGQPHPAADPIRAAWRTLPRWAYGAEPAPADRPRVVSHGDWHLGQVVRRGRDWLLVDIDDLGYGDPAWDLARPAAWYAAGLIAADEWRRFLDSYRSAGGVAVPPDGDPWPVLDPVARAAVVQMAATAVVRACREGRELEDAEQILVATCHRVAKACRSANVD